MDIGTGILIILGLALFETVNSIDNAVINAEVLHTVSPRARKWFLTWGMLGAVLIVRGLLPLLIVYAVLPHLGIIGALKATLSSSSDSTEAIAQATPILLLGAGVFLILLFLHWLFLEPKHYGLRHEKFFFAQGVWFYACASLLLLVITWYAEKISPLLSFAGMVGSTAFFIIHGLKTNAENAERSLKTTSRSDMSKLLYLELIDMAFSIDGVLGAFAFTLNIPLILLGNGIGAWVVRAITVSNSDRISKYVFLKHGAMYSVLALGLIMILHGFGYEIPDMLSPLLTVLIIGFFWLKSVRFLKFS